jgi:hypothetical protein
LRLAVKEWRVRFTVTERTVRVADISTGYRPSQLAAAPPGAAPLDAHHEFLARFPRG